MEAKQAPRSAAAAVGNGAGEAAPPPATAPTSKGVAARPPPPPSGSARAAPGETATDPRNLYVANFDPALRDAELFDLFRKYGEVISVRGKIMQRAATAGEFFGAFSSSRPARLCSCRAGCR
jgi:hypothetical protein